jgi:hypothetical protein
VKELNEARVLAVGPGGLDNEGKRVQCSVQPGDKVLIPQVCAAFPWGLGLAAEDPTLEQNRRGRGWNSGLELVGVYYETLEGELS